MAAFLVEVQVAVGNWWASFISESEVKSVSEAVAQAELGTQGEILPMIVRRSSVIGSVPWLLNALIMLAIVAFEWPQWLSRKLADLIWTHHFYLVYFVLLLVFFVLSHFLAVWLCRFKWVQRLLIAKSDQIFEVEERAQIEFYQNLFRKTEKATGVLIFISIMEQRAVILADAELTAKLPTGLWDQTLNELMQGIRDGKTGEALCKTISSCGELLRTHFPSKESNPNEVSNQLIIKE